jgi:hypothetical protein
MTEILKKSLPRTMAFRAKVPWADVKKWLLVWQTTVSFHLQPEDRGIVA